MRYVIRLLFIGVAVTSISLATARAEDEQKSGESIASSPPSVILVGQTAAEAKILATLEQPTQFDLRQAPLSQVAEEISRQHQIPVVVDSRGLTDVGLKPHVEISLQVADVSLESALKIMLRELDLAFVVRDEVLTITLEEGAEGELVVRHYPVGDLLDYVDKALAERPAKAAANQRGDENGKASSQNGESNAATFHWCGSVFQPGVPHNLESMLATSVAPDTWDKVGSTGSATMFGDVLVVLQTREVHDRILQTLQGLRRAAGLDVRAAPELSNAVEKSGPPPMIRVGGIENSEAPGEQVNQAPLSGDNPFQNVEPEADRSFGDPFQSDAESPFPTQRIPETQPTTPM